MKESELLRLNDYLALRVMELEAELELEKRNKRVSSVATNANGNSKIVEDNSVLIKQHRSELMSVNMKYRIVTQNHAKLKEDYENLKAKYADLENVKGLRRLAYAYAKRGFWNLFKRTKQK